MRGSLFFVHGTGKMRKPRDRKLLPREDRVYLGTNRRRGRLLLLLVSASTLAALATTLVGGYYYKWDWTGLPLYAARSASPQDLFQREKTFWDWLQLLIVPAVLAAGGLWFNQRREDLARELEAARFRDDALQRYLDTLTTLILDRGLLTSEPGSELRSMALTRTLTTLRILDGERRGLLVRFLYDTRLVTGGAPIISLNRADLTEAWLQSARLANANLSGAILKGAHLEETVLTSADLRHADLTDANLARANLSDANLRGHLRMEPRQFGGNDPYVQMYGADDRQALLRRADLTGAVLFEADASGADLEGAILRSAVIQGATLVECNLTGVDFSEADLSGTYPGDPIERLAWPLGASLRDAVLTDANFSRANLDGVDFSGAVVTEHQLAAAKSRNGVTMPDGRFVLRPERT
jgi:uncharacterized protein YjbI with pentapeptide repeats